MTGSWSAAVTVGVDAPDPAGIVAPPQLAGADIEAAALRVRAVFHGHE